MEFFLIFFLYLLIFLLSVASPILLACATYQDAKSLNNKDATLWAVLVGLFGLIPGIIYLCVRKRSAQAMPPIQQFCVNCRAPLVLGTRFCPYCGTPQPQIPPHFLAGFHTPQECAAYHNRAKKLLIAAIICWAFVIVLVVISVAAIISLGFLSYDWGLYY